MKYLYLVLLSIFFINCASAPKEYITDNNICGYDSPIFKLSKEDLIFNVKYDSIVTKEGDILIDKEEYVYEIQKKIIGKTEKKSSLTKWINYYPNSKISSMSFFLRNSSSTKIGKEFYYDKNGDVTKVINHDKGYNICWSEAIAIVKKVAKKAIKKHHVTGFNLQRTNLNEFPNSKPMWRISLDGDDDYNAKPTIFYWIDGITGSFVKTTKVYTTYD